MIKTGRLEVHKLSELTDNQKEMALLDFEKSFLSDEEHEKFKKEVESGEFHGRVLADGTIELYR